MLDEYGAGILAASSVDKGTTDNLGTVSLNLNKTAFSCADIGKISITLTARDGSDNTATAGATLFVADKAAPTFSCPGKVMLELTDIPGPLLIYITDLTGKVIFLKQQLSAGHQQAMLNVSSLPAGICLMHLEGTFGQKTVKLIIQK